MKTETDSGGPGMLSWELQTSAGLPALRLDEGEVGVWCASLEPDDVWFERFREVLSPDEVERASRFRFEKHRKRFIASRGILRHLIASSTGRTPEAVKFAYGTHGKPSVDGEIRFNMSDSGPVAVYAIGLEREIGIDIEQVRSIRDAGALARRFFSPREAETILRTETDRESAFFTCWTRKEAYIKARGEGLSMPLHTFEVSIDPSERPRLVSASIDPREVTRWSMDAFSPLPGYVAAIVTEGRATLRHYSVRYER